MEKDTIYVATQTTHDLAWIVTVLMPLLSAGIAVFIGWALQRLQKRSEMKHSLFVNIIGERHLGGYSPTFTMYLNQIPAVFYSNKKIIEKYNAFVAKYNEDKYNDVACAPILNNLFLLMAKDIRLKYIGDSITESPFLPIWQQEKILKDKTSLHLSSESFDEQAFADFRNQNPQKSHSIVQKKKGK